MKILAISDVILPQFEDYSYLHRSFSEVSLIVSCGDLSVSYLDFICSALNLPLFFVRGNHDTDYVPPDPGGDNLHLCFKKREKYMFAGLEGSIRYNSQGAIQYSETEMFFKVLRLLPRLMVRRWRYGYGVDIMVTHSPPKGIHDIPEDFAHRGFKSFRYLIYWGRPKYLIHGHVDTWDNRKTRKTIYGKTTVLNINPYMVLDITH